MSDQSDDEEPVAPRGGNRRGGVSAAVMDLASVESYVKKVVPKDEPTMAALRTTMSSNVLFQHLEKDEMQDVLDAMFESNPTAGTEIIKQGDDGDNFYVVSTGVCGVEIDGVGEVGEVGLGGSFGELALIYGTPRAATIRAKTDCKLWAIDRDTYRRILMGATMRKRKSYEEFLAKVKVLASLDKWERLSIADALEVVHFSDGEAVVNQGDSGDSFFIVFEGKAIVTKSEGGAEATKVADLSAGDYFGEIALLTGDKRQATVAASGELTCVTLDRERFERVLGPAKEILQRDMENYKGYQMHA